jgi:pyridoxal phosphate enzyme (YggS family)
MPQSRTWYDFGSNMSERGLAERIAMIRERISAAAKRAGRSADHITLIAVSKTHPADAIRAAYRLGVRHFAENRVQEWEAKRGSLQDLPAAWHLIGHLQSNKAARAARLFHSVDSVDDYSLAQRLDRARLESSPVQRLRVLIEVRVAAEETKSGVEPSELPALAEKVSTLTQLDFCGLMCIPPFLDEAEKVRPYFSKLRNCKEDLERSLGKKLPVLSMGMSHDFTVAIEEGATEVRVGTALFGTRVGPLDAKDQERI